MTYTELEQRAATMVTGIFQSSQEIEYPYHNLKHTQSVVEHVQQIASFYKLSEIDRCIVTVAAWFHDVGQLSGDMDGHEHRSADSMEDFLKTFNYPDSFIRQAVACVMVTQAGALPNSLNERIMCDADTWHFGTSYFRETEFLVQNEMEMRTEKRLTQWHLSSLALLRKHFYFTEYAQSLLTKGKQENIEWLESLISQQH